MRLSSDFNLSALPVDAWPNYPNVAIIRGDLIHPIVSGNKLFKLIPHINKAKKLKKTKLLSVGGRYSNHLHALAWFGQYQGLETIGIVRSHHGQAMTPTLRDCQQWEMNIQFIEPNTYAERYEDTFWQQLVTDFPNSYAIKEGGWSEESISGCASWWQSIPSDTEVVILPVGSGTTLAGLIKSAPMGVKVVGVPVYRDPDGYQNLHYSLRDMGIMPDQYELWTGHAGRGFGRTSITFDQFSTEFMSQTRIRLDAVYNAKSFCALNERLESGLISKDVKIAILHTGGLQGLRH